MKNKIVWITGASSGIGEEMAKQYVERGDKVILSARREDELKRVKNNCKYPDSVGILPLDLTNFGSLPAKVDAAIKCFGSIDLLINNGGVSQRSLIAETDFSVYQRLIDVNYLGTVALTKALLPYFVERQQGHFAVVTSVMGKYGSPFRSGYAGAKHALHGFFDVLRMEHQKDNVAVSLLCPGFVQTKVTINALTADGSALGHDDPGTQSGLKVEVFCRKAIKKLDNKAWESYFGKKEKLGVYLKRISQKMLHAIVLRSNVR